MNIQPFKCVGGPLNGDLLSHAGDVFYVPLQQLDMKTFRTGAYNLRRVGPGGMDFEWHFQGPYPVVAEEPSSDKARVLARYPKAALYRDSSDQFSVWDISHEERVRLNAKHHPQQFARFLLAIGSTEEEAWKSAALMILRREG